MKKGSHEFERAGGDIWKGFKGRKGRGETKGNYNLEKEAKMDDIPMINFKELYYEYKTDAI